MEAGGVQDLADVQLLVEVRRRADEDLRSAIEAERETLSEWGRDKWDEVQRRIDAA